jgi:hypothetical protein
VLSEHESVVGAGRCGACTTAACAARDRSIEGPQARNRKSLVILSARGVPAIVRSGTSRLQLPYRSGIRIQKRITCPAMLPSSAPEKARTDKTIIMTTCLPIFFFPINFARRSPKHLFDYTCSSVHIHPACQNVASTPVLKQPCRTSPCKL